MNDGTETYTAIRIDHCQDILVFFGYSICFRTNIHILSIDQFK